MEKIITVTNPDENWCEIERYEDDLTAMYQDDFARPPWNEVSRCDNYLCDEYRELSSDSVGCPCSGCSLALGQAYPKDELADEWVGTVINANGFMEIALGDDGTPQRATLARPTTLDQLIERKYWNVPAMRDALPEILPERLVWIEDTWANLKKKPNGNLKQRGETIARISEFYGGLTIATRTLAEQVVAATVRDCRKNTAVYIGEKGVGRAAVNRAFNNPGYSAPTVPDRRTLIVVKEKLRS